MDERPAHPENYTEADRDPEDVRWYVVHVAEATYEGCIELFEDPDREACTHYVMENAEDPPVVRMVDEPDIAWHAGNWAYNRASLGIEHAGFIDETTFVDGTYRASARLARRVAERFDIPLRVRRFEVAPADPDDGPGGFVGHDQIPDPDDPTSRGGANCHLDPGSTWNWGRFEGYLRRYECEPGDGVVAERAVSVREKSDGDAPETGRIPADTAGVIADVETVDGTPWYEVEWTDTTGWSPAKAVLFARFAAGRSVTTTAPLAVREGPGATAPERAVAPGGATGEVLDGPVDADGYRWWKVAFDGVATGWSAGWWLRD